MSLVGSSADLGEVQLILASLTYVSLISWWVNAGSCLAGTVGVTDPCSLSSSSRLQGRACAHDIVRGPKGKVETWKDF